MGLQGIPNPLKELLWIYSNMKRKLNLEPIKIPPKQIVPDEPKQDPKEVSERYYGKSDLNPRNL
jgi:hypothetical protein